MVLISISNTKYYSVIANVVKQSVQLCKIDYFVVPPRNDVRNSVLRKLRVFGKKLITASLRAIAKQSLKLNVIDYFVVPTRNVVRDNILSLLQIFYKRVNVIVIAIDSEAICSGIRLIRHSSSNDGIIKI